MSLQNRAVRIARDVIGIVLEWNDRHLSDKEAMTEITLTLLKDKEKENSRKKFERKEENVFSEKNKKEVLELEEKDIITEERKEKIVEVKEGKKSFQNVKFEKKLVPPLIISAVFILIVVGIVNPHEIASNFEIDTSTEDKSIQFKEIPSDDSAIRSEQFVEIPSDVIEKIQNGSKVGLEPWFSELKNCF